MASGTVVLNNKGKPVQRYEPFFSRTHAFGLEAHGSTATLFYDPVDRVVCTLAPGVRGADGKPCYTYEKVTFDAWQQRSWDPNDTVLLRPDEDDDVRGYVGPFVESLRKTPDGFSTWFDLRIPDRQNIPPLGQRTAEQSAAVQTMEHAGTYTESHLDTLGRTFLTVQQNRMDGRIQLLETRIETDIKGNQLAVIDPRRIRVLENVFDLGDRTIRAASVDAGTRINLLDVAQASLAIWDPESRRIATTYDALRRPTAVWVTEGERRFLAVQTIYGEVAEARDANAKGRIFRVLDGAGQLTRAYDFKGNVLSAMRLLARRYDKPIDWNIQDDWLTTETIEFSGCLWRRSPDLLGPDQPFEVRTVYDALNRATEIIDPEKNRRVQAYDKRNLLRNVRLARCVAADCSKYEELRFIEDVTYNAKGQREKVVYANGTTTRYTYDPDTDRLLRTLTERSGASIPLQDLRYTTDPAGNHTQIEDAAFSTVFHRNQAIEPVTRYRYDSLNRLIETRGREHEALSGCHYGNGPVSQYPGLIRLTQPVNNGRALRNYTETYAYDDSGNLTEIKHSAGAGSWTRIQTYSGTSNRITGSRVGCSDDHAFEFTHDPRGNFRGMPHLRRMTWDHAGNLQAIELNTQSNGPAYDRAYYVYDSGGQRARKILERGGEPVEEHVYLGSFEIHRKLDRGRVTFERRTLHVMDDVRRVALVEVRVKDINETDRGPALRVRYQLDNQVGSSVLEVDEQARPITYEEYHAYGGTAYVAGDSEVEVNRRCYRYSGKERDEESGLYYFGARYYAAWLGRWCSPDPSGLIDGANVSIYVGNSPTRFIDDNGKEMSEFQQRLQRSLESSVQKLRVEAKELQSELRKNYYPSREDAAAAERQAIRELMDLQGTGFWGALNEALNPFVWIREVSAKQRLSQARWDLTPVEWRTFDFTYAPTVAAVAQAVTSSATSQALPVNVPIPRILQRFGQRVVGRLEGKANNIFKLVKEAVTKRTGGSKVATGLRTLELGTFDQLAALRDKAVLETAEFFPGLARNNPRLFGTYLHANLNLEVRFAQLRGEITPLLRATQHGSKGIDFWLPSGLGFDLMTATERSVLKHEAKYVGKLTVDQTLINELWPLVYKRP